MAPTNRILKLLLSTMLLFSYQTAALSKNSDGTVPAAANSSTQKKTTLQIYFATTRLNKGSEKSPEYSGERHLDLFNTGSLEYGIAGLYKPEDLKSPSSGSDGKEYKHLLRKDADAWRKADFTFVSKTDEEEFFKRIHDWTGQICIYIHGYDKPFQEACEDASMLYADYQQYETSPQKKLLPILFSWPSIGGRTEYGTDEANLEWSSPSFDAFLDRVLKEKNPAAQVDIVGHSMGVRMIVWYLSRACIPKEQAIFRNLFLCSGDVDFLTFETKKKLLENAVSNKVFVFVSDRDKALILSHLLHEQPRLGRPIDPPKYTRARNQVFSSAYLAQLTTDTNDLLGFQDFTEPPDVKRWLAEDPKLDCELGDKSRFIDVSDIVTKDFGHGTAFSVIAAYMAGLTKVPQLKSEIVHKRPDRTSLSQNGKKPLHLYRFERLESY